MRKITIWIGVCVCVCVVQYSVLLLGIVAFQASALPLSCICQPQTFKNGGKKWPNQFPL